MKRPSILLVAVLALVLAACGGEVADATDTPDATPSPAVTSTPDATPTSQPEPTDEETPAPTAGGGSAGGPTGALADLLPDRVGGLERVEMPPGMESIFSGVLSSQGIDAEESDFVWAQWGTGELMLTALRAPGMNQASLDMLAQALAMSQTGSTVDVDAESVTVGGKSVLRMVPGAGGAEATVYLYVAGDAMFTVVAQSEDLAADLLSQLP